MADRIDDGVVVTGGRWNSTPNQLHAVAGKRHDLDLRTAEIDSDFHRLQVPLLRSTSRVAFSYGLRVRMNAK